MSMLPKGSEQMKKEYQQILLNKNSLVIKKTTEISEQISEKELGSLLLSFSSIGFIIEKDSIELLKKYSKHDLKEFYFDSIELLKKEKGDNVQHIVFYENFPNLENISESEYVLRSFLHYCTSNEETYGYMARDIAKKIKPYLKEKIKLTSLKIISEEEAIKEIIKYANNMFESKTAIPASAQKALQLIVKDFAYFISPYEIPFKENLAFYANCIKEFAKDLGINEGTVLSNINLNFIKTATDLLRVYVAFSDGDITLINNTKFISLSRRGRKVFLKILDEISRKSNYIIDDLASHEFLWKKALEKLHIGDYSNVFPNAYKVSTMLRNDMYKTYNASIALSYKERNIKELIRLLSIKPGIFARSIDYLARNFKNDIDFILESFEKISHEISTTVLLQLWEFYKNRNLYNTRIFIIKGPLNSFVKEIDDTREAISEETISRILKIIEKSLIDIYSSKDFIEDVYLDESMKNIAIPTNCRNASRGYKTLTFGSRVKLEDSKKSIIRFFTHWKNIKNSSPEPNDRVDVDLSLQLYDQNFKKVAVLSWHNMKGGAQFNSVHSGDITSAPSGASEFIDLDYKEARKIGRYAVVCNNVYTGQDFADIPECFSGVMFRKNKGKTGEIFQGNLVKHKFDLTQRGSSQNLAFVIDLETLEMIWVDFPYSFVQSYAVAANLNSNLNIVSTIKRALQIHMNMYDLIMLHKKHLEFCNKKSDAKYIIGDDSKADLSPYDLDKISSDWL